MELRYRRQTLLFTPSKKNQDLGECLHRKSKQIHKIRQKTLLEYPSLENIAEEITNKVPIF